MPEISMLDLYGQYKKYQLQIDEAIASVIASQRFIGGREVERFADNLAAYLGVKHAITTGSGTDSLIIALMALELESGSEVIVPSFTFGATVEAVILAGLKPVIVDVDERTMNISVQSIEEAITPATRAIIPVHLFGAPANMEKINALAQQYNLYVIEDACQAMGTKCCVQGKYKKAGAVGTFGCTSFFPSKNLGAYGDGGAIFTNDDNLAAIARQITNHGCAKKYTHQRIGMNSRLDAMQAAVLNVKLAHLDDFINARVAVASRYKEHLASTGIILPHLTHADGHSFNQFTIRMHYRDDLQAALAAAGVATMIYYPTPMHEQAPYTPYSRPCPTSELLSKEVLSLPIYPELTPEKIDFITDVITTFCNERR